jgi:hypothetical protein
LADFSAGPLRDPPCVVDLISGPIYVITDRYHVLRSSSFVPVG